MSPFYKMIIRIQILIIIYNKLYLFYKVYNILYKSDNKIGFDLLFVMLYLINIYYIYYINYN